MDSPRSNERGSIEAGDWERIMSIGTMTLRALTSAAPLKHARAAAEVRKLPVLSAL